jgi:hypothetical protein
MATVELKVDSSYQPNNVLTPVDLELAAITIDIFCLVCTQKELGSTELLAKYQPELKRVSYNSPLALLAYLKNVSVETAKHVFETVTYYTQEKEKRELANAEKKLDLLEKARAIRKRLIEDGFSSDEATRLIADVLVAHNSRVAISGPDRAPEKVSAS